MQRINAHRADDLLVGVIGSNAREEEPSARGARGFWVCEDFAGDKIFGLFNFRVRDFGPSVLRVASVLASV